MSLIKETEKYLKEVINKQGYKLDSVKLEECNLKEYGYFQINVAMQLANLKHTNLNIIASSIANSLDSRFTNVNIQGPGFINLTFSNEYLLDYFNKYQFTNFINYQKPKT